MNLNSSEKTHVTLTSEIYLILLLYLFNQDFFMLRTRLPFG